MILYVVKQGDTVKSIAKQYNISEERLILDNGIDNPNRLVPGLCIAIAYPKQTHTVKEGETLDGIAELYGVTVMQILRNNPYLLDREYIHPGEVLVISYDNGKGRIRTNGYANSFIDRNVLKKTLPYLTYLTVFGYVFNENGDISDIDDEEVIRMAKSYGVAPVMMLSTLTFQGVGNYEAAYRLISNTGIIEHLLNNAILLLRKKGYYGINLTFLYINEENRTIYENYARIMADRLKKEGFAVFFTLTPSTILNANVISFEKINYSNVFRNADEISIMNYNWGYSFGPPSPVISAYRLRSFLDFVTNLIPISRTELGVTVLGYDWELPYELGFTRANLLTNASAISLANDVGADIRFDDLSQTPFYHYSILRNGIPIPHTVWFIDARSIDAVMNIVMEYGLQGTGLWNIMIFFNQLWLVINSQYQIESLYR